MIMEGSVGESSKTPVQRNNVPIINIVNHSVLQDPKDMPETAFVIAFCVKFNEALDNLLFWPEVRIFFFNCIILLQRHKMTIVFFPRWLLLFFVLQDLDRALCSTEESLLLERLHRLFLKNLENSERKIE